MRLSLFAAMFVAILALGTGCDSFGLNTSERGTLKLYLTDNPFPFDLVEHTNVTITRVEILGAGGAIVLVDEPQEYDLLTLRDGVTALMSETELEAGHYSQIRVFVDAAQVVMKDEREFDLAMPSAIQTGIKILLGDFHVEAGGVTGLTLDFDVEESFIVQGNSETAAGIHGFLFTPVIKPLFVEPIHNDEDEDEDEDDEDED
jgi:hypothetical protein